MKLTVSKFVVVAGLLAGLLAGSAAGVAQEKGVWRAESKTARSITGDISFSGTKLYINFAGFTVAQIRELTAAEAGAAFDGADAGGSGSLYRLDIPAGKTFLHKNTLCGSESAEWAATYVAGRELRLAVFSGTAMPVLTAEALANTTSLCGTFSYTR